MRKEIMELWVKALRSGEYEQGYGYLNRKGKYCCLGVLCEIGKAECSLKLTRLVDGRIAYNGATRGLPTKILSWAGVQLSSTRRLANLNDGVSSHNIPGLSFQQIADVIEQNYREL